MGQSDAADPSHRRVLADADGARRHPRAPAAGPRRVRRHQAPIAESRGADQGNRQPGQAGVRFQLPGRGPVPGPGGRADHPPNMTNGADAPDQPLPINLQRLTDRV